MQFWKEVNSMLLGTNRGARRLEFSEEADEYFEGLLIEKKMSEALIDFIGREN